MDAAPIVRRLRWRLRGAWLWPSFVVLTVVDASMVHELPVAGDGGSWAAGLILGLVLNLLAVIILGGALALVIRRMRPEMPRVVARNYAGAVITLAVTLALLAAGLAHSSTVTADRGALQDALVRAEAYIGVHAPQPFQQDLNEVRTYVVQEPEIYRSCAPNPQHTRYYCVVVDRGKPFAKSVRYDGSEPNGLLSQGTG